jgi:hypothetical protein
MNKWTIEENENYIGIKGERDWFIPISKYYPECQKFCDSIGLPPAQLAELILWTATELWPKLNKTGDRHMVSLLSELKIPDIQNMEYPKIISSYITSQVLTGQWREEEMVSVRKSELAALKKRIEELEGDNGR